MVGDFGRNMPLILAMQIILLFILVLIRMEMSIRLLLIGEIMVFWLGVLRGDRLDFFSVFDVVGADFGTAKSG